MLNATFSGGQQMFFGEMGQLDRGLVQVQHKMLQWENYLWGNEIINN